MRGETGKMGRDWDDGKRASVSVKGERGGSRAKSGRRCQIAQWGGTKRSDFNGGNETRPGRGGGSAKPMLVLPVQKACSRGHTAHRDGNPDCCECL